MNLEEMETALKRFGFDSGDPLKVWLNAAMHDIEADYDWPFLEGEVKVFSTTAGSANVTVGSGSGLAKIISIRDKTNQIKLVYYDKRKFFREITDPLETGKPFLYTIQQNESFVHLWPIPDGKYEIESLTQLLTEDLANPTDKPKTEYSEWPVIMHWAIVQRAAAIALASENEEDRAKEKMAEYEKMMENLRRRFAERNLDEAPTVQDVMGYSGGPFASRYN